MTIVAEPEIRETSLVADKLLVSWSQSVSLFFS